MNRTLIALTATGTLLAPSGVALAQSPPTTVVSETTVVERDVTQATTETHELDDDDDDGNAGLWGLLGLLGLAGLAGIAALRRHDHDNDPPRKTPDAR